MPFGTLNCVRQTGPRIFGALLFQVGVLLMLFDFTDAQEGKMVIHQSYNVFRKATGIQQRNDVYLVLIDGVVKEGGVIQLQRDDVKDFEPELPPESFSETLRYSWNQTESRVFVDGKWLVKQGPGLGVSAVEAVLGTYKAEDYVTLRVKEVESEILIWLKKLDDPIDDFKGLDMAALRLDDALEAMGQLKKGNREFEMSWNGFVGKVDERGRFTRFDYTNDRKEVAVFYKYLDDVPAHIKKGLDLDRNQIDWGGKEAEVSAEKKAK